MKEFVTAYEDILAEDEYEAKVQALVDAGKTTEEAEAEIDSELGVISFKLDDRLIKAYPPHEGQLIFLLASMGRGQSSESRFSSIVNIMLESLRDEDADYLESRLLTRDRRKRIPIKQVEDIFRYLVEGWFGGKVSLPASDSADSPPTGGTNSSPPTT